ncbi:hypothetical protein NDU88_001704 [Pleurodeles waltl]|uniref:Uncharacterized protein n=1 Tax=Pleurodeles waltl TaxID=8319 RepID=A0AAV7TKV6_PLEWA|nr:hypothetical protein NDU88_001704 [Pleurodeles waltl]
MDNGVGAVVSNAHEQLEHQRKPRSLLIDCPVSILSPGPSRPGGGTPRTAPPPSRAGAGPGLPSSVGSIVPESPAPRSAASPGAPASSAFHLMWAGTSLLQLHGRRHPVKSDAVTVHSAGAAPFACLALTDRGPQPHTVCFRPAQCRRPQSGVTMAQGDSAPRHAGCVGATGPTRA